MNDPATCAHRNRQWSPVVIDTVPELRPFACLDCGIHGHRDDEGHEDFGCTIWHYGLPRAAIRHSPAEEGG